MPGADFEAWVERVLQSETFRHAPSSRRLLRYLADHAADAKAEPLKEYTIGVEAFGKPTGYDPRQDSTVRIQIGRLRKKLFEYYEAEGQTDAMVLVAPKGRMTLTCEPRPALLEPPAEVIEESATAMAPAPPQANRWRIATFLLAACLMGSVLWGVRLSLMPRTEAASVWTPELEELWRPFLHTAKPLIISAGNPLFAQFSNKLLYRDPSVENWEDLARSPNLQVVSKALGEPEIRPVHYYSAIGEVSAAFLLGQRLGPQQKSMSIFRNSQLLWQQMAESNVLFLGPPRFFGERLSHLPVALEFGETPEGFRNLHPQPGEQELYSYRDPVGYFAEEGEATVLVTHAPGPRGATDLLTFASNSTFGRVGAVDAFTDAAFAKSLVAKLRSGGSSIPQYFQVLLRVRYKGGIPTETSYLLHRALQRRD